MNFFSGDQNIPLINNALTKHLFETFSTNNLVLYFGDKQIYGYCNTINDFNQFIEKLNADDQLIVNQITDNQVYVNGFNKQGLISVGTINNDNLYPVIINVQ